MLPSRYGLVAMTFASHAKGREFDPHYLYVSNLTEKFPDRLLGIWHTSQTSCNVSRISVPSADETKNQSWHMGLLKHHRKIGPTGVWTQGLPHAKRMWYHYTIGPLMASPRTFSPTKYPQKSCRRCHNTIHTWLLASQTTHTSNKKTPIPDQASPTRSNRRDPQCWWTCIFDTDKSKIICHWEHQPQSPDIFIKNALLLPYCMSPADLCKRQLANTAPDTPHCQLNTQHGAPPITMWTTSLSSETTSSSIETAWS